MIDLYNPNAGPQDVDFSGTHNLSERKAPLTPVKEPTFGVSSYYLELLKTDKNRQWPKAVYFSYDDHPRAANNQKELDNMLAAGGNQDRNAFEPKMVAVKGDQVQELQKQVDVLMQAISNMKQSEKSPKAK